ncbi:MAG: hypothetical protein EA422_06455 [Gemmatimonadales bacterium]|nr:MAG: hypothetical protein EA422_06455 [Gemmatimonadales bacterium]
MRRGLFRTGLLAAVAAVGFLTACDMGFPTSEGEARIDEATFVATYTELRIAAMEWESQRLPAQERDAILQRQGVTADDLREFTQVHGRNVPVMNRIWNEVSENVQAAREAATASGEGEEDAADGEDVTEEGPPVAPVAPGSESDGSLSDAG